MRVLVTGGAGYIGSVIVDALVARGDTVVVYDNLVKGHRDAIAPEATLIEADLLDIEAVARSGQLDGMDAVVHMAAASLVGESMTAPVRYYENNVIGSLCLLAALPRMGARAFVFSSTAAAYGEPARQPIEETDPTAPSNPYGETKVAIERALHWHHVAYALPYVALRYFNAAGATAGRGERHDPETHLIPIVLDAAVAGTPVSVFGDDYPTRDGTCVRDYVHVEDLSRAHVMALDALLAGHIRAEIFNLGCGDGHTVREVVDAAARVTGRPIPVHVAPRRPGDPAVLVASAERIRRALGWTPARTSLDDIIGSAWAFSRRQAQGLQPGGRLA
jgi:UDP-glucose 4-epimerase